MNTFWPVYQRLEREVLDLAKYILFDDKQLKTYSPYMGELIIRCAIEIEALSKELYSLLGGAMMITDPATGETRPPYFDTECLNLLANTWHLNTKKIQIVSPIMIFSPQNSVLTPLHKAHKRGTSGSKWKQAYQNIKHDRANSTNKGTIENLINALGALYILNLYFRDDVFWSETPIRDRREYSANSEIFNPFICDATHITMSTKMGDQYNNPIPELTLNESIYIEKISDQAFEDIHKAFCENELHLRNAIKESPDYVSYLGKHPEDKSLPLAEIAQRIKFDIIGFQINDLSIARAVRLIRNKEIILNKHAPIYPTKTIGDYISSTQK